MGLGQLDIEVNGQAADPASGSKSGKKKESKTDGKGGPAGSGKGKTGKNPIPNDFVNNPGAGDPLGQSKEKVAHQGIPIGDDSFSMDIALDLSNAKKSYPKYSAEPSKEYAAPDNGLTNAVSSKRPEPIALFNVSRNSITGEMSDLYSSCLQALIEDRISNEYAVELINKIKIANPDFLSDVETNIQSEIDDAQNAINQLTHIFDLLVTADQGLNPTFDGTNSTISNIASTLYKELKIDPEPLLVPDKIPSPFSLLKEMTGFSNISVVDSKTRSALVMQLLYVINQSLSSGMTNHVVGGSIIPKWQAGLNTLSVMTTPAVGVDLKTLAPNVTFNLVYGLEEYSYINFNFFRTMAEHDNTDRALSLVSMVSNEFALSAGLGRLANTPLGNIFGAQSKNFTSSFLGVKNIPFADLETKLPNSLADYLLVSGQSGKPDTSKKGSRPTLLLDGTFAGSTSRSINAFSELIKTVARNPADNKMGIFDFALNNLNESFSQGIEFYKKVHLRDQDVSLLTPRGLFTRLLKDLSENMDNLSLGKSEIDKFLAGELVFLKTIVDNNSYTLGSNEGELKHFLLGLLVRKSAEILSGQSAIKLSNSGVNLSEDTSTTTNVKVITKGANQKVDEFTIVSNQEEKIDPYVPTDEVPRFVGSPSRESRLLDPFGAENSIRESTWLKLGALGVSTPFDNKIPGVTNFSYDMSDFVGKLLTSEKSLLHKLSVIFADMCKEANEMAKIEDQKGTWLNDLRLTRNSQVDGTLLLACLFEAALSLVDTFVKGKVANSSHKDAINSIIAFKKGEVSGNYYWDALAGAPEFLEQVISWSKLEFFVPIGHISSHAFRAKALRLLTQASEANDFSNLKDQNTIPELSLGLAELPSSSSIISNSSASLDSFISYFTRLAEDRDVPLRCFFSIKGLLDQTLSTMQNISSIGKMLRNEMDPNDLALSLRNFSIKDKAKGYANRFLPSASDYSLQIAQHRLDRIKLSLSSASGRLSKIAPAEIACIKIMLQSIRSTVSPNYLFYTVGLPGEFISTEILPSFSLSTGRNDLAVNESYLQTSIQKIETFSSDSFGSIVRNHFGTRQINENSFNDFANNLPKNENDMLNRVVLRNGMKGSTFLQKKDLPVDAKQLLREEVHSHLIKKVFSTISSADLNEHNLVNYDYTQRGSSSKNIAREFAKVAELEEGIFDNIFVNDDDKTILDENILLSKTSNTLINNIIVLPTLSYAEAELFYDIFGSIYFMTGLINAQVFSPSIFDKTIATVMSSNEFQNLTNVGDINGDGVVNILDTIAAVNGEGSASGQNDSAAGVSFDEFDVIVSRAGAASNS